MSFEKGTRIGGYEITGLLGTGGMGEVYRATDTKLRRDVAIKVLPEDFAKDAERLARFKREAQVLASLNHPNIAAIHGLEEVAGKPFLVLELVEGEDLTEKTRVGPLPLDEALSIAGQIAEALEEAHENGIVHRDLKPANVRVTPDGKVKVLDFGLAKAFLEDSGGAGGSEGNLSQSPTLVRTMGTHPGMILGTASYMAPEQARGKSVDKRADIWAFGVVFYEMLTGKCLFGGETISDRLAAVLTRGPDLETLPQTVPAAIRHLLARCLDKDPKRRLRDIGEARFIIQEVRTGGSDIEGGRGKTDRPARPPHALSMWWAVGGTLALLLVLAAGVMLGRRWDAGPELVSGSSSVRFTIQAPSKVHTIWNPALAVDGSFVAFEAWEHGSSSIYLHRFDEGVSRPLPRTEGAQMPFVSPDGRWIGYRQAGMLKKVAVTGGDSLTIGEVPPRTFPGAVWLPDGKILFAHGWLDGLWEISSDGGQPRPLTEVDTAGGEKGHWWPHLLPGGEAVLFTIWRAKAGLNDASIAILDTRTGKYRSLFAGADAWFLPPDHIIFSRAGAYHAIPFDLTSLAVTGDPVPVLDDATNLDPAGDRHMPLSVSGNGAMVYVTRKVHPRAKLAWVTSGKDPQYLPFPARSYLDLDLSPAGRLLAVSSQEGGTMVIRILDLLQGTEERLNLVGSNWLARWHPRKEGFAFLSMRKGDFDTYWKDTEVVGSEQPLLVSDADEKAYGWSPDGEHLLFTESQPDGSYPLKMVSIDETGKSGGTSEIVFPEEINVATVSHDGRWLAVESNDSGRPEIYVQPFPHSVSRVRISRNGGSSPCWSPDDKQLFFIRGREIIALAFRIQEGRFLPEKEKVVLNARLLSRLENQSLATRDGKRFLVSLSAAEPEPAHLRVVLNWSGEVAHRSPARR